MRNLLFTLVFLQAAGSIAAQKDASSYALATELSSAISGGRSQFVRTFDERFANAPKGSPFLFDEWVPGTLILHDFSRTGDSLLYKFDSYNNEVWARKIGGDSIIPHTQYIRQVDLKQPNGEHWQFKKYALDGAQKIRFCQPIYEGTYYTLVKITRKVLVKANFVERGVYTTGLPYDRFEGMTTDYFLQTQKDQPFKTIALKKGELTDIAPARYAKEVEAYCKKEKFSKKLTEQEAAKLLGFMDRQ